MGIKKYDDVLFHYIVTKNTDDEVDTQSMCNAIVDHVQNNEIYFDYMPEFIRGILCFGLVAETGEHEAFTKSVGETLKSLGCKLTVTVKSKVK